MNIKRNTLAVGTALVLVLLTFGVASAVPPPPSGFYGTVSVSGNNVPDNTVVSAWINGTQYGSTHTLTYNGDSVYSMEVFGDDPETAATIEGGVEGDTVEFRIAGLPAQTAQWHSGTNVAHNLSLIPTSVTVAGFEAILMPVGAVQLLWETVSEFDNQGFNLWRNTSPNDPTEQINAALIPSQTPGSSQGFAYEWIDNDVVSGETYYYWLEDIDLNGTTTLHGPVSATVNAPTAVTISGLHSSSQSADGWFAKLITAMQAFLTTTFSR